MKIDNVSFDDKFVKSFKTEEEFLAAMKEPTYQHFEKEKLLSQEQLKAAYAAHNPKKETTANPEKVEAIKTESKKA